MTDAELADCWLSQPPLQQGHGPMTQRFTLALGVKLESCNLKKQGLTVCALVALMAATIIVASESLRWPETQ